MSTQGPRRPTTGTRPPAGTRPPLGTRPPAGAQPTRLRSTSRALPPRKRKQTWLPLLLALVCFGCAALIAVVAPLVYFPARAAETFGPPAPGLSQWQVVRYSTMLVLQAGELTLPADPLGSPQEFDIQMDESAQTIISHLWQAGLIKNAAAFRTYLQYSGLDTSLQAGRYTLSPAMSPVEIAQELQDATPEEVSFVILPGWRMEEIAATLPTSGLSITKEMFIAAASIWPEQFSFLESLPEGASLEGFLFPDTYTLSRTLDAPGLVAELLGHFDQNVTGEIRDGFDRQGLSLYEGVTLASIVEREAIVDEEMALIASVFYNRLAVGMKLDSDPTVQYALGFNELQNTWWTNPLSFEDLAFDSTYNTYIYPSLPPGPIANPGLNALRATAFPAQTPYYYFRAGCDGSGRHLFAETFAEHLENECP